MAFLNRPTTSAMKQPVMEPAAITHKCTSEAIMSEFLDDLNERNYNNRKLSRDQ